MKPKIYEAGDLPLNERIYLKKDFIGWKVVHPIKNEDGTMNWKHFFIGGSYWNFLFLLGIVLIILGALIEYSSTVNMFLDCFSDPVQLELCKTSFGPAVEQATPSLLFP